MSSFSSYRVFTVLAILALGCGTEPSVGERGNRAEGKADAFAGSCTPSDCGSPNPSTDGCYCDEACQEFGDCCLGAQGAARTCGMSECDEVLSPCADGYACQSGAVSQCVPTLAPTCDRNIDICGNGLDENCDGADRACISGYPNKPTYTHTVTIEDGLALSDSEVDLWRLQGQMRDHIVSGNRVELVNNSSVSVTGTVFKFQDDGSPIQQAISVEPGESIPVWFYAFDKNWGRWTRVQLRCSECETTEFRVGFVSPPDDGALRFVGTVTPYDGSAAYDVGVVVRSANAGSVASIDECFGLESCNIDLDVDIVAVDPDVGGSWHGSPGTLDGTLRSNLTWMYGQIGLDLGTEFSNWRETDVSTFDGWAGGYSLLDLHGQLSGIGFPAGELELHLVEVE